MSEILSASIDVKMAVWQVLNNWRKWHDTREQKPMARSMRLLPFCRCLQAALKLSDCQLRESSYD